MPYDYSDTQLLTPTKIAREGLLLLENNLVMGNHVHRQFKNEFFNPKSGGSVRIRKPNRFQAVKSATLEKQNVEEQYTTFSGFVQAHVGWEFSTQDLTLTIEEYSERYIEPAIVELANTIDFDLCGLYAKLANQVGTPGVTPSSFGALAAAMQRLDELAVPTHERKVVLDPAAHWAMADALKGLYDQKRVREVINRGYLGRIANADIMMDQNIHKHLVGTHTTDSTPLTKYDPTAAEEGLTEIVTDGWKASTMVLRAGDVFAIEGVYEVNPVNRQSTGQLKQFVALNNVSSDNSGNASIRIYPTDDSGPGLRALGAYKNCTALPADGAAILRVGTQGTYYPMNLVYQKNALGLVICPLQMPKGAWGDRVTDKQTGLSIRVVKDYDITNDMEVIRLDILYAVKALHPDMGVRLVG